MCRIMARSRTRGGVRRAVGRVEAPVAAAVVANTVTVSVSVDRWGGCGLSRELRCNALQSATDGRVGRKEPSCREEPVASRVIRLALLQPNSTRPSLSWRATMRTVTSGSWLSTGDVATPTMSTMTTTAMPTYTSCRLVRLFSASSVKG